MCTEHVNSKLEAVIKGKCPRCRSGKMFMYPMFNLKGYSKMFDKCPVCGQPFEIETGFYWGAMYVSYAMSTGLSVLICVLLYYLFNPSLAVYITTVIAGLVVTLPMMFRYSRILMLHFISNVKYDRSFRPVKK